MADLTRKTANLLDSGVKTYTVHSVSIAANNGYYTLNGQASAGAGRTYPVSNNILLDSGTYFFKVIGSFENLTPYIQTGSTIIGYNGYRFTISEPTSVYLGFKFSSEGVEFDNMSFGVMLIKGETAPTTFEPYGWVHSLRKLGAATETIQSGDTIYTNGQPISTYTIKGNTVQNGTPTPSNPVAVSGTGDRTENLYNIANVVENTFIKASTTGTPLGSEISNSEWSCSDYIEVLPNTEYTVNYPKYIFATSAGLVFYTSKSVSSAIEGVTTGTQGSKTYTFTTPNNCNYVRFSWSNQNGNETTFVTGGTAKPYEPYGFKIPISTLQTINNYLGSIQSTRQINKIVFDGTETGWDKGTYAFYYTINDMYIRSQVICTHYEYYDGTSSSAPTNSISTASGVGTSIWIKTADHDTTTLDQWKAYLQAQYAAGTPVTVYYVLNTATTGTVNEPLMAIGTYADSISNAAAISTTDGANSISVDTTVQPSEFSATWTGWHDSSVKEKSENLFDKDNTTIENGYLYDAGTSFSWTAASDSRSVKIPCEANTQYTLSVTTALPIFRIGLSDDSNPSPRGITCTKVVNGSNINQYTFTTGASDKYIIFQGTGSMVDTWISELMLVEGSTAPSQYEPYWK